MTLEEAMLKTLAYHDIFNYPLTLAQIHNFTIGRKATSDQIKKAILKLKRSSKITEDQGMFSLRNRLRIFATRKTRTKYSQSKLKKAKFYSKILAPIPTIRLVGISGALAMENSDRGDDIDLVIATARNTLWTTRLLANSLLLPFKRDPGGRRVANRACLNLFLDESDLKIEDQNLYTAHEICQMKPILDRDKTYSRLIKANLWVKKYLPNWQPDSSQLSVHSSQKKEPSTVNRQPSTVEILLKKLQLAYMRSKISTERIGDTQLFFHPKNTQDWVLKEYQKRLRKLKLANY